MAKASSSGFQYQRRTREDVQARANQSGGNYDSIFKEKFKSFRPKDGKNLIRILPPTWPEARHYGWEVWVNYGVGVDNQSYLSLSKMLSKPDPLEEAKQDAEKAGDRKLADALKPKKRVVMWVIDRNAEEEGPQLWSAPWTVDRDIANLTCDEDTRELLWIDDPETGQDLRFYKEGKGLTTEYNPSKMKLLAVAPIHEDQDLQDDWIAFIKANPIPETLHYYTYDHIATIFDGHARVKDEEAEGDDPAPRGRKPAAKDEDDPPQRAARSRRAEPEAEDDPPPRRRRAEPDVEEDPPPRTRRRAAEPEDAEDDPPPRTRRRAEPEDDPEAEPEDARPSVRERLRSRLKDKEEPEAAEDDPPPRPRRKAEPEDAEDDPPPRRRVRAEPEEDPAPAPRRRVRA